MLKLCMMQSRKYSICSTLKSVKAQASGGSAPNQNLAGEAVSDIRAVHVFAPSWKEVIESGDSSSATSMKVFLTLVDGFLAAMHK